jgi:aldose 1-epimerase
MSDSSGPGARRLAAGDFEAVFLPSQGMLGASLRHRGEEILRRIEDLEASAVKGSSAGIPLLHPWANRLAGLGYRAAGRSVTLDPSSPLLHLDGRGLPMHGVPWSRLCWDVVAAAPESLSARLEWDRADLLAVFPFRHRLEMTAALAGDGLTLETTLFAGADGPVPVAFGFHPYVGVPGLERRRWRLTLPAMRRPVLDADAIPTGGEEACDASDAPLGDRAFDDGFALIGDRAQFSLAGGGRRISIELLEGYRYAQVYAPKDQDLIAFEPMTAPANALRSGRGLTLAEAGGQFRTVFRIGVGAAGI